MKGNEMHLIARNVINPADVVEFGKDFTPESALDFVAERDTDFDNPWLSDYEFILIDAEGLEYVLECGAWFELA